jgi:hypothetical protein
MTCDPFTTASTKVDVAPDGLLGLVRLRVVARQLRVTVPVHKRDPSAKGEPGCYNGQELLG